MNSATRAASIGPMHIDGEDIGWVSGFLVGLVGLWKGITLSLGRREKRIDGRFDAYLLRIENERSALIARAEHAEEQNRRLLIIIQMMAAEIERLNPGSNILAHAHAVLRIIPDMELPPELQGAMARLEEKLS